MRLTGFNVFWLAAVCHAAVTARGDEAIQVYTVPKEAATPVPAPSATGSPAMPAADIAVGSTHVTWTTPSTWKELKPDAMRVGNFAIEGQDGAKAEAAIFSFPGKVGTELGNVNRWRGELKLDPITQDQIQSELVTVGGGEGKLYSIAAGKQMTVEAVVPHGDEKWFFRMHGDKDVVTDAVPVFRDFLKTVKFDGAAATVPATAQIPTVAPAQPATDGGDDAATPKWTVPSNWIVRPAGQMVFKSFAGAGADGKMATINVSFFQGSVGGPLANVNRWRTQVSLPPVEESQLDSVTKPLEIAGGKGTMVDFTGTDSRSGEPGRLVAVMVPHNDSVWFYKLFGDPKSVEAQRETFVKFVQGVTYP